MPAINKNLGFSLLEVVFVLGVLALVASISAPIYHAISEKNNLDIATQGLVQAMRRAQTLAQNGKADSAWGVNIASNSVTVFAGLNYLSRIPSYDETYYFPGSVRSSGLNQIVFSKLTGQPQTTGTTTITSGFGNKTVVINQVGSISY